MATVPTLHRFTADELTGLLAAGAPPRFLRRLLTEYVDRDAWLCTPLAEGEDPRWRSSSPVPTPEWTTLVWGTDGYPAALAALSAPPPVLYIRGDLAAVRPGVAIVGSRSCTDLGRIVATLAAEEAASLGATVVSGLAAGVDTTAHEVALAAGATTLAFVGSALDTLDGPQAALAARIATSGGAVCSELPPGTPVSVQHLHARNRLVAACATPLVVAEAALRSGTIGCAVEALQQSRPVVVVRPRPAHRHAPGAAGLLALASPPARAAALLDLPDTLVRRFPSTSTHVANAVCDTRDELSTALRIFVWLHR